MALLRYSVAKVLIVALAALVGAGDGWWRHELDNDLELEFGWRDGAFRIEPAPRHMFGETFAGPVVPEATPNPRTGIFLAITAMSTACTAR